MTLGSFDRNTNLAALEQGIFDVVVIGGGITGCGVALDAAARGLRTALVERHDFASGTSSKSSKMVHGGLRYLQGGDVRLVYDALHERQRLLRNAPHLVRVLPFLIPIFSREGVVHPKVARALGSAMWAYDLTGGFRVGKLHRRLDRDETLSHVPTLRQERVASSYLYYDARADDARLTLTIARTAAIEYGAVVANHAAVTRIQDGDGQPSRRRTVTVEADGRELGIRTRTVVNAAGVWADDVVSLEAPGEIPSLRPAKGVHVTVPWELVRNEVAVVVPVRSDRRSVFLVPWPDPSGTPRLAYIGTTDTDYDGDRDDPLCTPADVDYLLEAVNAVLSTRIDRDDVLGTWAGLRPLVRSSPDGRTADLSRRHLVRVSPSGTVTVTGGKLTTYREMAADAVDAAVGLLADPPRSARRSPTARLRLAGARDHDPEATGTAAHLQSRYGGDSRVIEAMIRRRPDLGSPLVPGLPYLRAEARFAVRYEMAVDLDDVLERRTRARMLARDDTATAARSVAELVAEDLGWGPEEIDRQVSTFVGSVERERHAPELPETALDAAALTR